MKPMRDLAITAVLIIVLSILLIATFDTLVFHVDGVRHTFSIGGQ